VSYRNYVEASDKVVERSPWLLVIVAGILILVLSLRLFSLQVLQFTHFSYRSDAIRIKREIIEAPRGFIFDRNGEILAQNQMSYSITVDPLERDKFDRSIPFLATIVPELPKLLNTRQDSLVQTVMDLTKDTRNPKKLLRDVDFRLLSLVAEHNIDLPGVGGMFDQRRQYPYGPLAAHVIGYTGELDRTEYDRLSDRGYELGHSIGKQGVEKTCEDILKGRNGKRYIERNYLTRELGTIREIEPVPPEKGGDVTLTLDIRLETVAAEAFGDSILGALVALDPRNGEVLLIHSEPAYDPNEFIHVMSRERYTELVNDPEKPLFNRAVQATYPPGSTFKMLTAIAGMEEGIEPTRTFKPCYGSYYFGRVYKCWKEEGHGSLDMVDAIEQSCNVYFYQLGQRLPLDAWHRYGDMLGFGRLTGVDVAEEKPGTLPDSEYYKSHGVAYSPGMMLNLAIGQGENLVTVMQLAHYVGIIAMEGINATPHVVMTDASEPVRLREISPSSFRTAKEGMHRVVHGTQGTARAARIGACEIAGKTGTAQNPHGSDHKLFVAFAPYDNPRIAIACVAENVGDYPVSMAVVIGKRILEEFFRYYPETTVAVNE